MHTHVDRSWSAALLTGACIVIFAALLFVVARSFRAAIADIAESETRVTIVNADGSVLYDTDDVVGSHATREEVRRAFADGRSTALRHSETLNRDFLYCARRQGDRVVRLAVPYTGVLKSERLVWIGLAVAGGAGACIVLFVFLITRHISRRLDAQTRQLEVAAASEAFRREFTSNVVHELKSPLTAIMGAVEILDDETPLTNEERKDLLSIVHGESGRLGSLIGDILSLARIEHEECGGAKDFVEFEFADVVAATVTRCRAKATAANIRLDLVRNDAARVNGDAERLEEVVQNLIENAIRHSGSGRIEISSTARSSEIEVRVTDFGIGIAPEHLPHLFERFYRIDKSRSRALGGTGLGLAIVKHIVQLHGGTVSVRSEQGASTTFSFTLPRA